MPRNSVTNPMTGQETVFGRDQILARLWELANLSPEATKGSIAGQVKAMAMIVAIEGLLPDRRVVSAARQPAAPPVLPNAYVSESGNVPGESVTTAEAKPTPGPSGEQHPTPTSPEDTFPKELSWAPNAFGPNLDTCDTTSSPPRLSLGLRMGQINRGR
jgi:hypothetical protein